MNDFLIGMLAFGVFVVIVNAMYNKWKGYKLMDFRMPGNRTVNPDKPKPPSGSGRTVNPDKTKPPSGNG